jgi:outer membrane lipoprotein-sorting protein
MKKLLFVFLLLPFLAVNAQELDDILAQYFKTINQDKLSGVQSVISRGKIKQMGVEITMSMWQKRPDKIRIEGSFSGQSFIQTFDGTTGWNINPFTGVTEPKEMSADEIGQAKDQSDIDGFLFNYKDKGYKVELLPDEDVKGAKAHVISVMKADSSVIKHYISSETNLLVKTKFSAMGAEIESLMGDYKEVDGIKMPHSIETAMNGQVMMQIVLDEVKFNEDIPDNLFGKPEVPAK